MTNSSGNGGAASGDGYYEKLWGNPLPSRQFAGQPPFPWFLVRHGFISKGKFV
jgi:hypothetical protein